MCHSTLTHITWINTELISYIIFTSAHRGFRSQEKKYDLFIRSRIIVFFFLESNPLCLNRRIFWENSGSALNIRVAHSLWVAREYRSPPGLPNLSLTRRDSRRAEKSWTSGEFLKVIIYWECFRFYDIHLKILFYYSL